MSTQKSYYTQLDANDIRGGLYQVDTYYDLFKLNAATHFKDGMLAYVSHDDKYYQYNLKLRQWCEMDLQRTVVCDTEVEINGETITIPSGLGFEDTLYWMIRAKYSDRWRQVHDENMRAYAPYYQTNAGSGAESIAGSEDEFVAWMDACKKAAWNMTHSGEEYPGEEFDKKYGWTELRSELDQIQSDLSYLFLQMSDFAFDASVYSDKVSAQIPNIYVEYDGQSSSDIALDMFITRGGIPVDAVDLQITQEWDGSTLFSGEGKAEGLSIQLPDVAGTYILHVEGSDNARQETVVQDITIQFVRPCFYGCCARKDLLKGDPDAGLDDVKAKVHQVFNSMFGGGYDDYRLAVLSQPVYERVSSAADIEKYITYILRDVYDMEGDGYTAQAAKATTVGDVYQVAWNIGMAAYERDLIQKYKDEHLDLSEQCFADLVGVDGGPKKLGLQESVTVVNPEDGYYVWLCIPCELEPDTPQVLCDSMPFPLSEDVVEIDLNDGLGGVYRCFRSYGKRGIEAGEMPLEITY